MSATAIAPQRGKMERGQSLVELTFMTMVLIWLLLGILDLGRAYFTLIALRDAAGEGAYYGSIFPTWETSSDNADPNNVTSRVRNSAPSGGLIDWSSATITVTNTTPSPGNLITVSITYNYEVLTPFIGTIVGSQTLPLTASATAEILSNGS